MFISTLEAEKNIISTDHFRSLDNISLHAFSKMVASSEFTNTDWSHRYPAIVNSQLTLQLSVSDQI